MAEHKISYENIGRVLMCIKIVRGDRKFSVSDFEPIYAALYPEDAKRLIEHEKHSLSQTIGGRLFDYWKHQNGKNGYPRVQRLSPVPKSNADYKIVS